MKEDILDYCISLRESGLDSSAIRQKLVEKGLQEPEIKELLRESDQIHLENLASGKPKKVSTSSKNSLKTLVLLGLLAILLFTLFGYARIGIIVLFVIWGSIRMLKSVRKEGSYFSQSKYRN